MPKRSPRHFFEGLSGVPGGPNPPSFADKPRTLRAPTIPAVLDMLCGIFGPFSSPIDKLTFLPHPPAISNSKIGAAVDWHSMDSVIFSLQMVDYE